MGVLCIEMEDAVAAAECSFRNQSLIKTRNIHNIPSAISPKFWWETRIASYRTRIWTVRRLLTRKIKRRGLDRPIYVGFKLDAESSPTSSADTRDFVHPSLES